MRSKPAWTEITDARRHRARALGSVRGGARDPHGGQGAGDHILVSDSVYQPTRNFCERFLTRMNIETTFYDPWLGAEIETLVRPNTTAIFLETPGSQTFEIQDVPAITAVAAAKGLCTILDNTWATPLFFPPHRFGIDLAIEAGTKYLSGHADLLLGLVSANERWLKRLRASFDFFANCPGPEDVFLALRGLRTLELRLREAERQGLDLATMAGGAAGGRARVLHPALPDCPGHDIWKRVFKGSSGLFSAFLKPVSQPALAAFLDGLKLFGMGYSWGGYESLVIPFDCSSYRTATKFNPPGPALRFSIGLEDPEDLKADLAARFERLNAIGSTNRAGGRWRSFCHRALNQRLIRPATFSETSLCGWGESGCPTRITATTILFRCTGLRARMSCVWRF